MPNTIDLLKSLILKPDVVGRYSENTAMFGKPKSTDPFPFPQEVMEEFFDIFQSREIQNGYPCITKSIAQWKYTRDQSLLSFLIIYCDGVGSEILVRAVLSALIKLLEKHPGSLWHEFCALHQIRNTFNFEKKRQGNRYKLIEEEKSVFEKIIKIHELLEVENIQEHHIQQALQIIRGEEATLTLDQCKTALLILEAYHISLQSYKDNLFSPSKHEEKNCEFLIKISSVNTFGNVTQDNSQRVSLFASENIEALRNNPNIQTSKSKEISGYAQLSQPKELGSHWVNFFKRLYAINLTPDYVTMMTESILNANASSYAYTGLSTNRNVFRVPPVTKIAMGLARVTAKITNRDRLMPWFNTLAKHRAQSDIRDIPNKNYSALYEALVKIEALPDGALPPVKAEVIVDQRDHINTTENNNIDDNIDSREKVIIKAEQQIETLSPSNASIQNPDITIEEEHASITSTSSQNAVPRDNKKHNFHVLSPFGDENEDEDENEEKLNVSEVKQILFDDVPTESNNNDDNVKDRNIEEKTTEPASTVIVAEVVDEVNRLSNNQENNVADIFVVDNLLKTEEITVVVGNESSSETHAVDAIMNAVADVVGQQVDNQHDDKAIVSSGLNAPIVPVVAASNNNSDDNIVAANDATLSEQELADIGVPTVKEKEGEYDEKDDEENDEKAFGHPSHLLNDTRLTRVNTMDSVTSGVSNAGRTEAFLFTNSTLASLISNTLRNYYNPNLNQNEKNQQLLNLINRMVEFCTRAKEAGLNIYASEAIKNLKAVREQSGNISLEAIYKPLYMILQATMIASLKTGSTRKNATPYYRDAVATLMQLRRMTSEVHTNEYFPALQNVHLSLMNSDGDPLLLLTNHHLKTGEFTWSNAYKDSSSKTGEDQRYYELLCAHVLAALRYRDVSKKRTLSIAEKWLIVRVKMACDAAELTNPFYNALRFLALTDSMFPGVVLLSDKNAPSQLTTYINALTEKNRDAFSIADEQNYTNGTQEKQLQMERQNYIRSFKASSSSGDENASVLSSSTIAGSSSSKHSIFNPNRSIISARSIIGESNNSNIDLVWQELCAKHLENNGEVKKSILFVEEEIKTIVKNFDVIYENKYEALLNKLFQQLEPKTASKKTFWGSTAPEEEPAFYHYLHSLKPKKDKTSNKKIVPYGLALYFKYLANKVQTSSNSLRSYERAFVGKYREEFSTHKNALTQENMYTNSDILRSLVEGQAISSLRQSNK